MRRLATIGAMAAAMLILWGLLNARADPVVRRATLALMNWPARARPVRVALLSDVHFGSVAMGPGRLRRIVAQINMLRPDLIVIAGDFVAGHDKASGTRAIADAAPILRGLRAPLGVVAVRGNHDNWGTRAQVHAALTRAGVTVLENWAVVRGPLAIGGLADITRRHDIGGTARLLRQLPGAKVLVAHEPDFANYLPADVPLLLAGHTHCGQVLIPFYGAAERVTDDPRLLCGVVRFAKRITVITGGLGTSVIPLRFGAPPDVWLLTLGPRPAGARPGR